MSFEGKTEPSFRDLSAIQNRFADEFMSKNADILGVRVLRRERPPVIEVKHSEAADPRQFDLPASYRGLRVVLRAGAPAVIAV